jgi:hypothetical protein
MIQEMVTAYLKMRPSKTDYRLLVVGDKCEMPAVSR